jgi:hypothetical protein
MNISIRVNLDDMIRKMQVFRSKISKNAYLDIFPEDGTIVLSDENGESFAEFNGKSIIYGFNHGNESDS